MRGVTRPRPLSDSVSPNGSSSTKLEPTRFRGSAFCPNVEPEALVRVSEMRMALLLIRHHAVSRICTRAIEQILEQVRRWPRARVPRAIWQGVRVPKPVPASGRKPTVLEL